MITGGAAVGFWGHIRTTMDVDIVIQVAAPELLDLFLKKIGEEAYVSLDEAKNALAKKGMFNIINNETCFKVDIIPLDEKNAYEIEKFSRRLKINFEGKDFFVISPEDLIISKLIWSKNSGGSERQRSDCESIWVLNKSTIDTDYMKSWAAKLGIKRELGELFLVG
jgi:hypothetical protein